MDEVVCNPMIVCVNHKFGEFESITLGLGRKKTLNDLNSRHTKIYEMSGLLYRKSGLAISSYYFIIQEFPY